MKSLRLDGTKDTLKLPKEIKKDNVLPSIAVKVKLASDLHLFAVCHLQQSKAMYKLVEDHCLAVAWIIIW